MRNLKKILALVLALVMTMSVMSIASAKFEDEAEVNSKYATAVEVLNGLGVFKGYEQEDGTFVFNPKGEITRAEVAAIIYRIDTADLNGNQVKIYSDYNKFDDVNSNAWYAGYVNYCANAEYIKGYDEHTFGPTDPVTGYQALAMIMRVIGYDKNGEFTGSAWTIQTAKLAQRLKLTKNVNVDTLGENASRELVAELLFRALINEEAYQVDYTLLENYKKVDEPIGFARFGLSTYFTHDAWGRPSEGWKSFNKIIVEHPYEAVETYEGPVDQCTIVKETGVKGDVTLWLNGVATDATITGTHNLVNHVMGEQGTITEVYATGDIVMIDTYLAVVTGTQKAAYDKNGHQYRPALNEFAIFGGPEAEVVVEDGEFLFNAAPVQYVTVAGNNYTNGTYWLVNYHEVSETIVPYAAPTTANAKQTYIWWNAEKHTIAGDIVLDNVNYTLDYAGYDKSTEYTWFFDTLGNVIGSTEIIIPEAEKEYAIVLGAQWMNGGFGELGYALAKIYNVKTGEIEVTKIAKVDTYEMQYADRGIGEVDFTKGLVSTTYQLNTNTWNTLYQVKETANGLELITVGTDLDVTIKRGVSRIGNTPYLSDNNTVFFFYNAKTNSIDAVVGYDSTLLAKLGYLCEDVDVVVNNLTGFAQFVYIPTFTEIKGTSAPSKDVIVEKYVYITGDAMNYKLKDSFALLGVVDAEGSTEPLYFDMNYAGNETATEAALNTLVNLYQDMLCYVTITNGEVTAIEPVALDAAHEEGALFVGAEEFYFIGTGVMVLDNGVALNVNHNTVIITEDKVGNAVNDMELVYGQNLYVVYEGTTAVAIFVTPTVADTFKVNGIDMNMADVMVMTLTADDLADVSASFTYSVSADVEAKVAAIAEAVANSTAMTLIDGMFANDVITITVGEIEMLTEVVALVEITVATDVVVTPIEIVVAFAEDAE